MSKKVKTGKTIGIIGGGQLGKMLAQSAKAMGYNVGILDPGENCSAAQVSDFHLVGAYDDIELLNKLKDKTDVITYEFENIPVKTLDQIIEQGAYIPQGSHILSMTQDRITEKNFLNHAGIPVTGYIEINSLDDLENGLDEFGFPAVLKTTRFGYDGKGQVVIKKEEDIGKAKGLIDSQTCILEQFVPFEKELSVMAVRNEQAETALFPASENIHVNHILHQSIVPARVTEKIQQKVHALAHKVADALDLVGIVGIELFMTEDGSLMVNELAPRPHNSGHYSIEACDFSQFDLHIKAICGLPIKQPVLHSPVIMTNVLGQHVEKVEEQVFEEPDWHLHMYGKGEAKENRKMGHITVLTDDFDETLNHLNELTIWQEDTE